MASEEAVGAGLPFGLDLTQLVGLLLPQLEKAALKAEGPEVVSRILHVYFHATQDKAAAKAAQQGQQFEVKGVSFHDFGRQYKLAAVDDGPRQQ